MCINVTHTYQFFCSTFRDSFACTNNLYHGHTAVSADAWLKNNCSDSHVKQIIIFAATAQPQQCPAFVAKEQKKKIPIRNKLHKNLFTKTSRYWWTLPRWRKRQKGKNLRSILNFILEYGLLWCFYKKRTVQGSTNVEPLGTNILVRKFALRVILFQKSIISWEGREQEM